MLTEKNTLSFDVCDIEFNLISGNMNQCVLNTDILERLYILPVSI